MRNVLFIAIALMFAFSCDSGPKCEKCEGISKKVKQLIFDNLSSRYTGFELVEVRKDSANVYTAMNQLRSISLRVAESNVEIVKRIYADNRTAKTINEADSINKYITVEMTKFQDSRFERPDKCFYVKYLVYRDELKIPKEEYYYINKDQTYVEHRDVDWNTFLLESKYDEIVENAMKYYSDLLDAKYN